MTSQKKHNLIDHIILFAAGRGTRMKGTQSKLLLPVGSKQVIQFIATTLGNIHCLTRIAVIGYQASDVRHAIEIAVPKKFTYVIQRTLRGTGNALKLADDRSLIPSTTGTLITVNGDDSVFLRPASLLEFAQFHHKSGNIISMLFTTRDSDFKFSRVILKSSKYEFISSDQAAELETDSQYVHTGIYAFQNEWLKTTLKKFSNTDRFGNYQLVNLAQSEVGVSSVGHMLLQNPYEWMSLNTPQDYQKVLDRQKFVGG